MCVFARLCVAMAMFYVQIPRAGTAKAEKAQVDRAAPLDTSDKDPVDIDIPLKALTRLHRCV